MPKCTNQIRMQKEYCMEFRRLALVGDRGAGVTANLLRDSQHRVQVRAVYDPDRTVAAAAVAHWGQPARLCPSYQDAIRAPGVLGNPEVSVRFEVFHFAGDLAIEGFGIELGDFRNPAAACFEALPCGG